VCVIQLCVTQLCVTLSYTEDVLILLRVRLLYVCACVCVCVCVRVCDSTACDSIHLCDSWKEKMVTQSCVCPMWVDVGECGYVLASVWCMDA